MYFPYIHVFKTQAQNIIQDYASFQKTAASWKCSLRSTTASVMHTDVDLQSVYKIFIAVAQTTARPY